jgi:Flp pilus assembly protein TadG
MVLKATRHALLRQDGQALAEIALLLPMVCLLLFGITEFGRAYQAYLALGHATREGARIGSLGGSNSEIDATIRNSASGLNTASISVSITPDESSRLTGTVITVRVDYPFVIVVPIISRISGTTIPLSVTLSMRVE